MFFNAQLQPNGEGGFVVTFDSVPEAITEGATREEALASAADALELALLGYAKDGLPLPVADVTRGANAVFVGAPVAAKLVFYEAFRNSGMSKFAPARKLGMPGKSKPRPSGRTPPGTRTTRSATSGPTK